MKILPKNPTKWHENGFWPKKRYVKGMVAKPSRKDLAEVMGSLESLE